jgi:four helix bundle protein
MIRDYRDLLIWQGAMKLAQAIYSTTATFPAAEMYGLTSQIRRSAVSVPSDIAEGYGRENDGDFRRFLAIARGSLAELQTQLILSGELGFIDQKSIASLLENTEEVARMIRGMQKSLANS